MLSYCRGHREFNIKLEIAASSLSVLHLYQEGEFPTDISYPQPNRPHPSVLKSGAAPSEVPPTVCSGICALLCSWDTQTGDVAWRVHSSHLAAMLTLREGNWDGTGPVILTWSTPRSPSLSWSCVDLVASLQSSDLVSFIARLYMETICLYQSFAWLFPNFSFLYRSHSSYQCVSRRQDVTSFLPDPLSSPSQCSRNFPLNASVFPLGSRAMHGFWNWLKQFVLPWQRDAKTKHMCLLVLNQDFSYSFFPSFLFRKHG